MFRRRRPPPWYRTVTPPAGWPATNPWRPRRSVKVRVMLWFGRRLRWVGRKTWARRRPLAPLLGILAVWLLGAVAYLTRYGWRSIVLLAVLAAGWAVGRHRLARARPRWVRWLYNPRRWDAWQWWYTTAVWAACTSWLVWAAVDNPLPPRAGALLGPLVVAWVPMLWRYRIRDPRPTATTVTGPELVGIAHDWAQEAAVPDGIAPGSTLLDIQPLDSDDPDLAVTALVRLPARSKVGASTVATRTEGAAMVFDRPITDVALEPVPGRSPLWLRLTVFQRNPLQDRVWWPGVDKVFDQQTGVAQVARYITGGTAAYRYYGDSGIVHDLIAGATGTGKSAFVNALLAIERACPWMASVVIDPQRGQSLPAWRGQVAMYGRSLDEGTAILVALAVEMWRRNKILSEVAWTDEHGHPREGIESFDPRHPVIRALGLPLIVVTVEEADIILANQVALNAAIILSTKARKCGIKLRFVFQTPTLEQAKSTVLRDQLVGGNVMVFRTGSRVSGTVVLDGVLPASPHLLPREWDDGSTASGVCYVLGPGARPVLARTWPIYDVYAVAHAGDTTMLPELDRLLTDDTVPEPAAGVVAGADATPAPAVGRRTLGDRILGYLDEHRYATTGTLAQACGVPDKLSSISSACRRLVERGRIADHGHGMWGSLATAAPQEAAA